MCLRIVALSGVSAGSAADELRMDEEKKKKRRKVLRFAYCHAGGTLLCHSQDWLRSLQPCDLIVKLATLSLIFKCRTHGAHVKVLLPYLQLEEAEAFLRAAGVELPVGMTHKKSKDKYKHKRKKSKKDKKEKRTKDVQ